MLRIVPGGLLVLGASGDDAATPFDAGPRSLGLIKARVLQEGRMVLFGGQTDRLHCWRDSAITLVGMPTWMEVEVSRDPRRALAWPALRIG